MWGTREKMGGHIKNFSAGGHCAPHLQIGSDATDWRADELVIIGQQPMNKTRSA